MEKQVNSQLINGIDVRRLISHKTLAQLNDTVNYIVFSYYGGRRHKNYVRILRYIAQYSVRFLGVSWRRIEGIAHDLGIDERTVRRVLARLQKLGVIKRIKTRKVSGLRGVDIIVINRAENPTEMQAEPCINDVQTDRESAECPSKMSEHKAIKTYKTTNKTIDDDIGANIDGIFNSAAESAGLPAAHRPGILARIKRYAEGIVNLSAYITATVKRAVSAINVNSNAVDRAEMQRVTVGDTFKDAVKAATRRQNTPKANRRIAPLPSSVAAACERDKAEYEAGKAAQQAESYEETYARIQALLAQMQK